MQPRVPERVAAAPPVMATGSVALLRSAPQAWWRPARSRARAVSRRPRSWPACAVAASGVQPPVRASAVQHKRRDLVFARVLVEGQDHRAVFAVPLRRQDARHQPAQVVVARFIRAVVHVVAEVGR